MLHTARMPVKVWLNDSKAYSLTPPRMVPEKICAALDLLEYHAEA
jgi:hypothetical protein